MPNVRNGKSCLLISYLITVFAKLVAIMVNFKHTCILVVHLFR